MDDLMTTAQVAEYLGKTPSRVRQVARQGYLIPVIQGPRTRLYRRTDVDAYRDAVATGEDVRTSGLVAGATEAVASDLAGRVTAAELHRMRRAWHLQANDRARKRLADLQQRIRSMQEQVEAITEEHARARRLMDAELAAVTTERDALIATAERLAAGLAVVTRGPSVQVTVEVPGDLPVDADAPLELTRPDDLT